MPGTTDSVRCIRGGGVDSVGPAEADPEGVGRVGNAAVARLLPDADGVVLVGEVLSSSKVVALESSSDSCEPLTAPRPGSPPHVTLNLTDLDPPAWSSSQPVEVLDDFQIED